MKISCPHCGVHGSVEDSLAGKKLRCPKCSKVFLITDDMRPAMEVSCPHCGVRGSAQDTPVGKKLRCRECSKVFLLTGDMGIEATEMIPEPPEIPSDVEAGEELEVAEQPLYEPETEEEPVTDSEPESGEEAGTAPEDEPEKVVPVAELLGPESEGEDYFIEEVDEKEVCSKCGESFQPDLMEAVGEERYCALCRLEEIKVGDEADLLAADVAEGEIAEEAAVEGAVAQSLMADETIGEEPQENCSVCGESFHPDFLQEVNSKYYCGICQPDVVEEVSSEAEGAEAAVAAVAAGDEEPQEYDADFTAGEIIKEAWRKTKGAKGAIWMAVIVMYAVLFGLGYFALFGLEQGADPAAASGTAVGINALSTLLSTIFTAGIMLIGVRRALEQRVSWTMVFAGFSKFLSITVAVILQTILVLIGFLLVILPGIYLTVGYTLTMPLILEKGLGPWQALEASRKAIHKKWWTVFGLYLVMMLLMLVAFIPLGLGLIWTVPMFFVMCGVLYARFFGSASGVEVEGEEEQEPISV